MPKNRKYNSRRSYVNSGSKPFVQSRVFVNSNVKKNVNHHLYPFAQSIDNTPHFYPSKNRNMTMNLTNDYAFRHQTQRTARLNLRDVRINISSTAMTYAVEQYIPSIRILCDPQVKDYSIAEEIIEELFTFIEKDFRQLNPDCQRSLEFDHWYIDKTGDLICFTRQLELYIYFCDSRNYPSSLTTTDIRIARPRHLPWQRMVRLSFVPNYITLEEIRRNLFLYFQSIFNIQEMPRTQTETWRHLRLELVSRSEYDELINDGEIMINGHLIPVETFVLPLRVLLCSKCNDPGHYNTICDFPYEACRRCGDDRSIGDHQNCLVCCHRCQQSHPSNDNRCPYLLKYRRALYSQLSQRKRLLTPILKTYIPVEYRDDHGGNDRYPTRFIVNDNVTSTRQAPQPLFNINDHAWPPLSKEPFTDLTIPRTQQHGQKSKRNTDAKENLVEETEHNHSGRTDGVDNVTSITSNQENPQDGTVRPSCTEQESPRPSRGSNMDNTADDSQQERIRFREVCNNSSVNHRKSEIVENPHHSIKQAAKESQVDDHQDNS